MNSHPSSGKAFLTIAATGPANFWVRILLLLEEYGGAFTSVQEKWGEERAGKLHLLSSVKEGDAPPLACVFASPHTSACVFLAGAIQRFLCELLC